MSQQYDNNMRGVLFKNDRKEKDTHPDYKGSCEINGEEMWMSAWLKQGQRGTFMSFSFTPKEPPKQKANDFNPAQDYDEDIPF